MPATPTHTGLPTSTVTPSTTPTLTFTFTPTVSPTSTLSPTSTATSAPQVTSITYTYDGDGRMVKSVLGEVVTYYVGSHYEKKLRGNQQNERKYYFAGANRIAMRENGTLIWLISNHLGSTSVTADAGGNLLSSLRYTAFGEVRATGGTTSTDYRFTGQRSEAEIGLYNYVARFYDPALGRFIQADSIIPDPTNSVDYDRYSYVRNNPARYTDGSGHCIDGVTTALCIAMAAGAVAGYAVQVGENLNQGMGLGAALTTNISAEKILGGAVIAGGVIIGAAAVSAGLAAVGISAGAACIDGDCTNEAVSVGQVAKGAAKTAQSVWSMNPFNRGVAIENTLGRSPQLTQNFPVIDRFQNGIATSIKSIDLMAKSYQNTTTLTRTVQRYINTLVNWKGTTWGNFAIQANQITGRELLLAIPPNASQGQLQVLQQLQQTAVNQGVTLILTTIQ